MYIDEGQNLPDFGTDTKVASKLYEMRFELCVVSISARARHLVANVKDVSRHHANGVSVPAYITNTSDRGTRSTRVHNFGSVSGFLGNEGTQEPFLTKSVGRNTSLSHRLR